MSANVQRVFVTTAPVAEGLYPTFLVDARVRDSFISQKVTERFGAQEDGSGHEWAAYDEPCRDRS